DPPYVPLNKTSSFTSYTQGKFAIEQQVQLAEVARQLAENGVQVMLSNSNCDFTRELYKGFYQHEVKASRAINSKADSRGKISELVITSYAVEFVGERPTLKGEVFTLHHKEFGHIGDGL